MRSIKLALATIILFTGNALVAKNLDINTEKSTIEWTGEKITGKHMGNISVESGFLDVKKDMVSGGKIVIDMNSITNTDIESETVEADHFMNIVKDCFSDRKVDYIQIDTEGYDYHILKMIDFKNLDISIIKLEFVNLSENEKMKSKTILKENGFYTFVEGIDLIGINLKKVNF